MIASALERRDIKKGRQTYRGNKRYTGIALAMIAQLLNIEIELVLPEDSTKRAYANHASIQNSNSHAS
jgi:cysteine synthase B